MALATVLNSAPFGVGITQAHSATVTSAPTTLLVTRISVRSVCTRQRSRRAIGSSVTGALGDGHDVGLTLAGRCGGSAMTRCTVERWRSRRVGNDLREVGWIGAVPS